MTRPRPDAPGPRGVRLEIERFEGNDKSIAVLEGDAGLSLRLPRSLLPEAARPGDVLRLRIEVDAVATRELADEARCAQADLSATDPGGDIKI